jgi:hypothetical protein
MATTSSIAIVIGDLFIFFVRYELIQNCVESSLVNDISDEGIIRNLVGYIDDHHMKDIEFFFVTERNNII